MQKVFKLFNVQVQVKVNLHVKLSFLGVSSNRNGGNFQRNSQQGCALCSLC
jgi:hypothetical protein